MLGAIIILALIIFLLSNRDDVAIGYWPFGLVIAVPLGAVVLAAGIAGFFGGLLFHLPARMAARRRARGAEKRLAALEAKAALPGGK